MEEETFISPRIGFDNSDSTNRKVVCKSDISSLEVIVVEKPLVQAINGPMCKLACHYCFKEMIGALRCSGCKYTYYCCQDCQMADWKKGHKKECKVFKGLEIILGNEPDGIVAMGVKMFIQIEELKNMELKKVLDDMVHFPIEKRPWYDDLKTSISLTMKYLERQYDASKREEYVTYVEKFLINGTCVMSDRLKIFAQGYKLLANKAKFNHSCEPNLMAISNSAKGDQLITTRKVKAGEELCYSYVSLLKPVKERRKRLKEFYNFDCKCPRCLREENMPEPPEVDVKPGEIRTLEGLKTYMVEMEFKLPEFDYRWIDVLEYAETIFPELKAADYHFKIRQLYTPKFKHWFGEGVRNLTLAKHYSCMADIARHLKQYKEALEYATLALEVFKFTSEKKILDMLHSVQVEANEKLAAAAELNNR